MTRKKESRRGSALAVLMVFMMVFMISGVGLLSIAQHRAVQTTAAVKMDKQYYSAESAVQLASQMLLKALDDNEFKKYDSMEGDKDPDDDISGYEPFISGFEADMREELQRLYSEKVAEVINGGMEFNGETAELGVELGISKLEIIPRGYKLKDDNYKIFYRVYAYLAEYEFTISAVSGGRAVMATIESGGEMNVTVDDITKIIVGDFGGSGSEDDPREAFVKDQNGKLVTDTASDEYNNFVAGFEKLIARGKNYSESAPKDVIDTANQQIIASGTYTAATVSAVGSSVKCDGNLTLDNIGTNNTIEYLHVDGNLTIQRTVNLPNLKAVYVRDNLNVAKNADLRGNGARNPDNGMIIGSNFVVGGNMTVALPATVYNCRFYAPSTINVNTDANNQKLTGNSVYVAYGDNGTVKIGNAHNNTELGDNTNAPQFYAADKVETYLKGNPGVYGIYAALKAINRDQTSTINFNGFFLLGPGVNGGAMNNGKLNDAAVDNLLDFGAVFNAMNTVETTEVTNEEYLYTNKNGMKSSMNIREITGNK